MIVPEGAVTPGRPALQRSDLPLRANSVFGNDRISLANALHAGSLNIFNPGA